MGTTVAVIAMIIVFVGAGTSVVVYRERVANWFRGRYTRSLGRAKSRSARAFTASTMAFVGIWWVLMGVFLGLNYFVWRG